MTNLATRQIHLDFHTSPDITGIGQDFDPEVFAATAAAAHVNSMTVFARCHHGMLYYASRRFPERIHPHLARPNLLNEQIAALHARGIRAPIYVTVQWDHYTAREHPEWLCRDEKGAMIGQESFQPGFYQRLCLNTPYRDFLKDHVDELFALMPAVDGFFFDIVAPIPCACPACVAGMRKRGMDPADAAQRLAYGRMVHDDFVADMSAFVRSRNPRATIFYNKGHIGPAHRPIQDAYTHFELESLPSGGWGYQHFPITMRYARTLDLPCVSHTGKFHTTWGDFHSFKNPEALQFECFRMIAMGCRCEVGDQMEPRGVLSPAVYDLVGGVYAEIEKKEPWCFPSVPVSDMAVLTPEAFAPATVRTDLPDAIQGANQMLEELGHQFDIVDPEADFGRYRVLILPDCIPVNAALKEKLESYLAQGGALLLSHESGLTPDKAGFALDTGLNYKGPAAAYRDFLMPTQTLGRDLPATEHTMYLRAAQVEARDAQVLSWTYGAWFDRTWEHFCSHQHAPSIGQPAYPGIARKGNIVYFSHPVFTIYRLNAPRWCRSFVRDALALLLPRPALRHGGPTTLLTALNDQPEHSRRVLHLLHYLPLRRSQTIDIVDDVIPVYSIPVEVRADGPVSSVRLVPEGGSLPYEVADGYVRFTVPEVNGHQMVEIS